MKKMSDNTKFEFIKMLDKFEELTATFDSLQAETEELKKEYEKDPNNEELLAKIKAHEEKYKSVYEEFEKLNAHSKEILDISNTENDDSNK